VVQGPDIPLFVSKPLPEDLLLSELPPMRCAHYAAELPLDVRIKIEKAVASGQFKDGVCKAPPGTGFEGKVLLRKGKVIGSHIVTVGKPEEKKLIRLRHGNKIHYYIITDNPAFRNI